MEDVNGMYNSPKRKQMKPWKYNYK